MSKSPDAFRTISEVAEWLEKPAHVLRFWESKFPQVKPVKRAGGRRYYRPEDMLLLGGIKKLLHDDGMTIKGAQKIVREQGIRYVSGLSQPLDDMAQAAFEAAGQPLEAGRTDRLPEPYELDVEPAEESATVLVFDPQRPVSMPERPEPETPRDLVATQAPTTDAPQTDMQRTEVATAGVSTVPVAQEAPAVSSEPPAEPTAPPQPADAHAPDAVDAAAKAPLPSFMRAPAQRAPAVPPLARPRIVDVPPLPDMTRIVAAPGLLSMILSRQAVAGPIDRDAMLTAQARLTALRDRMAQRATD